MLQLQMVIVLDFKYINKPSWLIYYFFCIFFISYLHKCYSIEQKYRKLL